MRYEILFENGGFIPEADSICLRETDALWNKEHLYAAYENEQEVPGYISPFLASASKHPYLKYIVAHIAKRWTPKTLRAPWKCVGNAFSRKAFDPPAARQHYCIPISLFCTDIPHRYFIPRR